MTKKTDRRKRADNVQSIRQAFAVNSRSRGMNFEDLLEAFLRSRKLGTSGAKRQAAERTVYEYRYDLDRFFAHLREKFPELQHWNEVKVEHLSSYIDLVDRKKLKPASKMKVWRSLKALLKFIQRDPDCKQENMRQGIADLLECLPTIKANAGRLWIPSKEELKRFLKGFDQSILWGLRDYTACLFMLDTGARIGAVCDLKVADIKWDGGMAALYGEQLVPLSDGTRLLLKRWLRAREGFSRSDFVFINSNTGGPCIPSTFDQAFEQNRQKLKMQGDDVITPHTLRHYYCTDYLVKGGSLQMLQRITGHKQVTTLMIYVHMADQMGAVREEHSRVSPVLDFLKNDTKVTGTRRLRP